MIVLENEIERLTKARECADEEAGNLAKEWRRNLRKAEKRVAQLEEALGDAMRSLELGDKNGAMGALRAAQLKD